MNRRGGLRDADDPRRSSPLEYTIIGFPDNDFSGEIIPELAALVDGGLVRIVDMVFVAKGDDGSAFALEVGEHDHLSAFEALEGEVGGVIGPDDIEHAAESIAGGSSVLLLSEVHPFADGSGRIARVMMNAELLAARQSKIIVPTGFRSDYLGALRRLSRDNDPTVYIKALRFLHDYTAQIDWTSHDTAEADFRYTNAFEKADDAPRVRLLRPAPPA